MCFSDGVHQPLSTLKPRRASASRSSMVTAKNVESGRRRLVITFHAQFCSTES